MAGRRLIFVLLVPIAAAGVALSIAAVLPEIHVAVRGLLAGVFLLAGAAKLRDRASFSRTLRDAGMPATAAQVVATLLPLAELAVAVALLVPPASTAGALGAVVLLALLTIGAGAVVARGLTVECGCFGKDGSARLSTATLLRNGVLAGLAGALLAADRGPGAGSGQAPSGTSVAAIGVAALVAVGLLAARRGGRDASDEPGVETEVAAAGAITEAGFTRRRWIRAAGGAGLAGALGSWLGWLDVSTADAVLSGVKVADTIECTGGCVCCNILITATGPVCRVYCCSGCTGFSGGGVVTTPTGTAQAAFFGNKAKLKGRNVFVSIGALSWLDPGWQGTGLLLQIQSVTSYRRVPGTQVRELVGVASANGHGKHAFVLRVTDGGRAGSGSDTVKLTVNGIAGGGASGSGNQYLADGHLTEGDITTNLKAIVTAK